MLGPIGTFLSNSLRGFGFIIHRPTKFEKQYKRNLWAEWFGKNPELFADVYKRNRDALASTPTWVPDEILSDSFWSYGVSDHWRGKTPEHFGIDDINPDITTADLLSFLARQIGDPHYLEIGVSLGKTLVQILAQPNVHSAVALDIEDINPIIMSRLGEGSTEWSGPSYKVDTLRGVKEDKTPTLRRFNFNGSAVDYLSADQYNPTTWSQLSGRKFNLIFSDGVHSAETLRTEYNFLNTNDLVAEAPFAMVWDDLYTVEMQSAFHDVTTKLRHKLGGGESAMFMLPGSYGFPRLTGVFSVGL